MADRLRDPSKPAAVERQKVQRIKSKIDKYKEKIDKVPVCSKLTAYVVCTGAHGHSKCLVLKTDFERYMFNCGETAMKNYHQVLGAAHAINNIFFTYNSWSNIGGVVGTFITMTTSIQLQKPLNFHGPPDVEKVLTMNRYFAQLEASGIGETVKCRTIEDGPFEDDQLRVEYVKLVNTETDTHNKKSSSADSSNGNSPEAEASEDKYALAYIITPAELPRGMDKQKIRELNLPGGKWMCDLKNGESITLKDGRVIHPDDVLSDVPKDRQPILVFECPTLGFLDSLLSSTQLLGLSGDPDSEPQLIVHMSPAHVTTDIRYKQFCDRFGSSVRHLMMNEESPLSPFQRQMQIQTALNMLQPAMFPLLTTHHHLTARATELNGSIVQASLPVIYMCRPLAKRGITYLDNFLSSNLESTCKKSLEAHIPDLETQICDLQSKAKQVVENSDWKSDYPKITILGSGSAEPTQKRNASCILLEIRPDEYMLLDCGEGTLAQMFYIYEPSKVMKILANLKAVFISHLHYDHHGGLFNIFEARLKAQQRVNRDEPLRVIGPRKYMPWLEMYTKNVNSKGQKIILHKHEAIGVKDYNTHKDLMELLHIKECLCVSVIHTPNSRALVMTHDDGWKLVYSGDCRPSRELAEYGKYCDILIHEATFGVEDHDRANLTKHSTTLEAIEVGRMMGAKFTLLTHFSQREFVPDFDENFTDNVGFVFDFMTLKPQQLRCIPLLKQLVYAIFKENKDSISQGTEEGQSESKRRKTAVPSSRDSSMTREDQPTKPEVSKYKSFI